MDRQCCFMATVDGRHHVLGIQVLEDSGDILMATLRTGTVIHQCLQDAILTTLAFMVQICRRCAACRLVNCTQFSADCNMALTSSYDRPVIA